LAFELQAVGLSGWASAARARQDRDGPLGEGRLL
jgi:hypothetical protein